jgi:hypothetical protein
VDRDREKKGEKKLAIGFVVMVIIIIVLLLAFATPPDSDNGYVSDPTAFRVGQTTIEYNNTSTFSIVSPKRLHSLEPFESQTQKRHLLPSKDDISKRI